MVSDPRRKFWLQPYSEDNTPGIILTMRELTIAMYILSCSTKMDEIDSSEFDDLGKKLEIYLQLLNT